MDKYIYDESNGLWYELQDNYYLPCLSLPTVDKKPIGIWEQRHKRYLKEHRKATDTTLLTSGKLNTYLTEIDQQAQERFEMLIEQMDLIRIYASSGKVFSVTHKGEYALRLRLYEIEERLPPHQFVRISNSEIINLKKVNNSDLSFTGTICVKLANGTITYVSRRYVSKLKKILGI